MYTELGEIILHQQLGDLEKAKIDVKLNGIPETPSKWQRQFGWSYTRASEVMDALSGDQGCEAQIAKANGTNVLFRMG